jgi:hypothetical protein
MPPHRQLTVKHHGNGNGTNTVVVYGGSAFPLTESTGPATVRYTIPGSQ